MGQTLFFLDKTIVQVDLVSVFFSLRCCFRATSCSIKNMAKKRTLSLDVNPPCRMAVPSLMHVEDAKNCVAVSLSLSPPYDDDDIAAGENSVN